MCCSKEFLKVRQDCKYFFCLIFILSFRYFQDMIEVLLYSRYNRYRRGGYRRYGGRGRGRGGRRDGPGRDRTESEGEEGQEGRKDKGDGEGT